MSTFILIFLALLEIQKFSTCLPYRGTVFPKDEDTGYNARAELSNYNFEEPSSNNCDNENNHDIHYYTNNAGNFQHDPEFHRKMSLRQYSNDFQHNPEYHQRHLIPQDYYHTPEHNFNQDIDVRGLIGRRNTRTGYTPDDKVNVNNNANSLSPVIDSDVKFEQRTILDAPTNCKQRNYKGRCIKY